MCVCVCVSLSLSLCACVRAYVRACARACVRACVYVCLIERWMGRRKGDRDYFLSSCKAFFSSKFVQHCSLYALRLSSCNIVHCKVLCGLQKVAAQEISHFCNCCEDDDDDDDDVHSLQLPVVQV